MFFCRKLPTIGLRDSAPRITQNKEGAGHHSQACDQMPPPGQGIHLPAPSGSSTWPNTTTGRPRRTARRQARQLPVPGWKATRPAEAVATTRAARSARRARTGTLGPPPAHQMTHPPLDAMARTLATADTWHAPSPPGPKAASTWSDANGTRPASADAMAARSAPVAHPVTREWPRTTSMQATSATCSTTADGTCRPPTMAMQPTTPVTYAAARATSQAARPA